MDPENYANIELEWVACVSVQGEFRRYKGDYVLAETDIRTHRNFPDAVVQNDGAFCLHYPGNGKYDFGLKYWEWDELNVPNLMMADKHISVTHVAGSNSKFMGNGGQNAIATAAAAHRCRKYNTTPRGVYKGHLQELKRITSAMTRTDNFKAKL
ncbi:uncharacterized protein EURHEDRAFT_376011 [Aspergillus ruber CBS 135680]|uniref:Uncharacterized protein n=1 Tax=Aspergillus ruber (strain CBS 135680) TaxID=1388766 RepID=A0A017SID9_ASPRC|nr:uncharacterized protein EURHEDRAFT_376011 [Aspergillus ruber CBS 135680]EYE96718.1 hypothetical protein EURHEDRAFT_376011 [Aspergillus ruber CBS 135680]